MQNSLSLFPSNRYVIDELYFFMGEKICEKLYEQFGYEGVKKVRDELIESECITVCKHVVKDNSDYYIFMTRNYLIFANRYNKGLKTDFSITAVKSGREFQARKNDFYHQGVFLIQAPKSIYVVITNQDKTTCRFPTDGGDKGTWGISDEKMRMLCDAMDAYFFGLDEKSWEHEVSRAFEQQILEPIIKFTDYEGIAEQIAAYGENYFTYFKRNHGEGAAKKKVFKFYSDTFDPDDERFQQGDRVAVETSEIINDEMKKMLNGTIVDRVLEDDSVRFDIEIDVQFDDFVLPEKNGKICLRINDTQKRVREAIVRKIRNGSVESEYMYDLFSKYEPAGYEEQKGWNAFKNELMKQKYPPNASQMEAIKRGIETKDIQLVLGPPGTGKTTVIVSWIKYFVGQGKRVLISSQNNAAVDNVLERIGNIPNVRIIRIGDLKKIQDNCKQYSTEKQVEEKTAEYLSKLKNSTQAIRADLENTEKLLDRIVSSLDTFERLKAARSVFESKANMIKSQIGVVVDSFEEYEKAKKAYEHRYEEYIKKGIAYYTSNKKNKIWKFFFRKVWKRLESEYRELENEILTEAGKIKKYSTIYNGTVGILEGLLKDEKYVESKGDVRLYREWCRKIDFSFSVTTIKDAPSFDKKYNDGYDHGALQALKDFYLSVQGVKKRLRIMDKAFKDWENAVGQKRNEIVTNLLIQNSNVVGATCIGINTRTQFRNLSFDVSIIDECGQIQIHNVIVPMSRAPKTLMLGDHKQIPPMTDEKVIELCKTDCVRTTLLEQSFFEFLFSKLSKKKPGTPNLIQLEEQFRMPGMISDVISEWFYDGKYRAHYDMSTWREVVPGTTKPLVMVSTSREKDRFERSAHESDDKSPGYENPLEAAAVAEIICKVLNANNYSSDKIGIISAYGKQVRNIRKQIGLCKLGLSNEQIYSMVASLDSFQGQERPLIIYSLTRSTNNDNVNKARVGFMKELRRLNVAFTRCQKQLIILGDFDYLTSCQYEEVDEETGEPIPYRSEKVFAEFISKMIEQAKKKGQYFELEEFRRVLNG